MKSGIQFRQGDILIVPFPFSDLNGNKQRPVLVLSKIEYNDNCEDVVTCGITSNQKDSKYAVLIENKDLVEGRIPTSSRIKVDKLFTLEKTIIIKKIARINAKTFEKVKKEFISLI